MKFDFEILGADSVPISLQYHKAYFYWTVQICIIFVYNALFSIKLNLSQEAAVLRDHLS